MSACRSAGSFITVQKPPSGGFSFGLLAMV
jgi:hypothetical protein